MANRLSSARTIFHSVSPELRKIPNKFQEDLLSDWAVSDQLSVNPKNTVHVRFTRDRTVSTENTYNLNGESNVKSGWNISVFTWTENWNGNLLAKNTANKMRKLARYVGSLFRYQDSTPRNSLFKSLILPLFDYCCPNTIPSDSRSLDFLEKGVIRFVKTLKLQSSHDAWGASVGWLAHKAVEKIVDFILPPRIQTHAVWRRLPCTLWIQNCPRLYCR